VSVALFKKKSKTRCHVNSKKPISKVEADSLSEIVVMVDQRWALKVGEASTKNEDNYVCSIERRATNEYIVCFHAKSEEAEASDADPTE
jgi:hypothetical protein